MSYEMIALLMFSSMMLLLFTGQRVFGAIGAVAGAVLSYQLTEGLNAILIRFNEAINQL